MIVRKHLVSSFPLSGIYTMSPRLKMDICIWDFHPLLSFEPFLGAYAQASDNG